MKGRFKMKKKFLLTVAFIGLLSLAACSNNDDYSDNGYEYDYYEDYGNDYNDYDETDGYNGYNGYDETDGYNGYDETDGYNDYDETDNYNGNGDET